MFKFNSILLSGLLFLTQGLAAASKAPPITRPITDDVFYFVMTDRFADGYPSNNWGGEKEGMAREDLLRHGYEPAQESFYHGGDLRGVTSKLDYLEGLGVTAIWLSPLMKNRTTQAGDGPIGAIASYHGYWPLDFTTIDPHLGTEQDFHQLIAAAHRRGIKVFIDVIVNHTADVIAYRECKDCPYRARSDFPTSGERQGRKINPGFVEGDPSPANFARLKDATYAYTPFLPQVKLKKMPEWLNNPLYYHNRGNSTFSGENSEWGDFYGLDDLYTEHPRVVSGMIDIYAAWIKKYKFDGMRVDTVKHVNIEFWRAFVPAMHEAARSVGLKNFFIFGEVFTGDPALLSHYTRQGKMDSVLDFAIQGGIKDVVGEGQGMDKLHQILEQDDLHRVASSPQKMFAFLSNHDIGRFAFAVANKFKEAKPQELLQRVSLAHALLFFTRGVPVLYYGDEQGFVGSGGDKGAREDMFPTKTASYAALKTIGSDATPAADNFDPEHPLYKNLSRFAKLRRDHASLRLGEYVPWRDYGPHLFAFKRSLASDSEDYLLIFNLDAQAAQPFTLPASAQLIYPPEPAREAGKLAPLSFVVYKIPRLKTSARSALAFSNLKDQQRVAKLFFGEVNAPEGSVIAFSMRAGNRGSYTPLYTDRNPPYRAYIDGFPDGTPLSIRAEVKLPNGKSQMLVQKVLVDARPPLVTIHYANGNQRKEAFHISRSGRLALPQALSPEGTYRFTWPIDEEEQTLIFSTPGDPVPSYDKPVHVSYRDHVLPHLRGEGIPEVTLYIDPQLRISAQAPQVPATEKPSVMDLAEASPLGSRQLYVRGGMNTWQIKDQLRAIGGGSYEVEVQLSEGLTEFKIADAEWSADSNFGGPVSIGGLSVSGGSSNLSVTIPSGAAGTYRIQLSFATRGDDQTFVLTRIDPKIKDAEKIKAAKNE